MGLSETLRSKRFQSLIGFGVSAALLTWLACTMDWAEVSTALVGIHLWALIPCTAAFLLHYALRSWRWRYLLPEGERIPLKDLFDAIMVGSFASFVLPLRAGEFVRPLLISAKGRVSFVTCFVSVVVERFFDLSMVLISFGVMVMWVPGVPSWAYSGAWALSVLASGILLFMIIGSIWPAPCLKLVDLCTAPLPKKLGAFARKFAGDFLQGAAVLSNVKNLALVVTLSVLVWLSCYLFFFSFLLAFDLPHSLLLAVSVAVIVALAVAAPSAPGFVGVYQTATVAAFALFGLGKEIAVAYSILSHVYQYVIFVGYGLFVLSRLGMKLGDLRRSGAGSSPATLA